MGNAAHARRVLAHAPHVDPCIQIGLIMRLDANDIAWAKRENPAGVRRLAAFVGAPSTRSLDVAEACDDPMYPEETVEICKQND